MTDEVENLPASYEAMLAHYVAKGDEDQLQAAYVLGRSSFAAGVTLLELLDLHRAAVDTLFAQDPKGVQRDKVMATFEFLAEALGTFEMVQLGYREAQERARLEQERATRERAVALRLQKDLLPARVPDVEGFDVAVRYRPAEVGSHAGGDWYDLFTLEETGRAGVVVGDVTGHGVGAAAVMGQIRIAVLAHALSGSLPDEVITAVDLLFDQMGTNYLATLVYVVADRHEQCLRIANAGHPPPLLITPDGEVRRLSEGHDRLVGVKPPLPQRQLARVEFAPGCKLLLYTDGLIEQAERQGKDGVAHLVDSVSGFQGSPDDVCDQVVDRLAPASAEDDICVVAIELRSD